MLSSAQDLVTEGSTNHGTIKFALGVDSTTAPTDGWSTTVPQGTDVGNYYVWWFVDNSADTNYEGTDPACITVEIIDDVGPATCVAPTAKTSLTYNKSNQTLINAGSSEGTGTIKYTVTDSSITTAPAINTFGYDNTTLPTKKDAGDYNVWYYVSGTVGEYEDTTPAYITVNIAKANATITTGPTGVTGLQANGTELTLINATGVVADTTLEYSLDDGANWSTTVPTS